MCLQIPVHPVAVPLSSRKLASLPTTASKSMFGLSESTTSVISKREDIRSCTAKWRTSSASPEATWTARLRGGVVTWSLLRRARSSRPPEERERHRGFPLLASPFCRQESEDAGNLHAFPALETPFQRRAAGDPHGT